MPDVLNKLQPDRTMYLRGFDHLGAGAAMHNARPDGFEVTGVFRDPSDFAVLVVWDADGEVTSDYIMERLHKSWRGPKTQRMVRHPHPAERGDHLP